jgi:hypothetical protein
VIHVVTAVITIKGENTMTSIAEATETASAPAAEAQKGTKRARDGARRAHVAPKKAKSGRKASPAKKAPKGAKRDTGARDGSKSAKVLAFCGRPAVPP